MAESTRRTSRNERRVDSGGLWEHAKEGPRRVVSEVAGLHTSYTVYVRTCHIAIILTHTNWLHTPDTSKYPVVVRDIRTTVDRLHKSTGAHI